MDNEIVLFAWAFVIMLILSAWKFVDIIIWCIQHIRIV